MPQGSFDADSGEAMQVAAVNGLGIAQLLMTSVTDEIGAGTLRVVMPERRLQSIPVHMLHGFETIVPKRADVFIDFVAQCLTSLNASARPSVS